MQHQKAKSLLMKKKGIEQYRNSLSKEKRCTSKQSLNNSYKELPAKTPPAYSIKLSQLSSKYTPRKVDDDKKEEINWEAIIKKYKKIDSIRKNKRINTLRRIKQGREDFKMLMEEKHSKLLSSEKKREQDASKINEYIAERQEKASSVLKRRLMQAKIKEQIDDIRFTEHKQNMEVVKYSEYAMKKRVIEKHQGIQARVEYMKSAAQCLQEKKVLGERIMRNTMYDPSSADKAISCIHGCKIKNTTLTLRDAYY